MKSYIKPLLAIKNAYFSFTLFYPLTRRKQQNIDFKITAGLKDINITFFFYVKIQTDKPELLVSASPDPIQVTKGKPLYLNCSADGNPSPTYTWTLPFNSSSIQDRSVFTVNSVGFEHEGVYNCTVRNTEGTVEVKFNVNVKGEFWLFF